MSLADWIMRAATDDPPRGREQWAHAMRAEYASLDGGKLSWALGCWTTMLGWRLRADAFYLATMLVVTSAWAFSAFDHYIVSLMMRTMPHGLFFSEFVHPYLVVMLLVSIALSAFRPDRVFVTSVAMIALKQVQIVALYFELERDFPGQGVSWPIHTYNTPYFVGVFAMIGACFIGAQIGQRIARLWRGQSGSRVAPAT
jgi:hypothetical protein